MPPFETRSGQFGLVSGIQQPHSDLILAAEPSGLFAPEARKGQLYIIAEAEGDVARGRDACQLAIKTIRKLFYDDSSYSVTSSLRKAIVAANKALYEHNFSVAAPKRAVVGATYPQELAELRQAIPHAPLLVPGYGSQGAGAADVAAAFTPNGLGALVNSSRAINFAHRSEPYASQFGPDKWEQAVDAATRQMIADLAQHTPAGALQRA